MRVDQGCENEIVRYSKTRQRLIYEGAVYHITQRAPGKELIFIDDTDYLMFLGVLKSVVKKFKLKIFSFSLLSNHIHLLIQITEKNLSVAMKNLFETYAFRFNKKYERKGHVFCGRFRSSVCDNDTYFLTASVYVHLNAVRAGYCDEMEDYRWHSLPLYIEQEAPQSFVDTETILSLLSKNLDEARKIYRKTIKDTLDLKPGYSTEHRILDKIIRRGMQFVEPFIAKNVKNSEKAKFPMEGVGSRAERQYLVLQLRANGYSAEEIRKKLEISQATYYRLLGNRNK